MNDLINRQYVVDALDEIESEVADGYGFQYEKWRKYFTDLPSAQPDCIECLRKIDDYGEEHYVGDNDKMFWDIRSILENPKHSEANHYGESTEIVRCKDCKHHWTHHWTFRPMGNIPTETCELEQTFYDANVDFCSLAERGTDERTD